MKMKFSKYVRLPVVLILFVLIACSSPESSQKGLTNPVEVSLNPYIGRLVTVEVVIGSETLKLILDTGGGETIIGPNIASRLGCNPSGRSVGYRMTGEQVVFQHCPDVTLTIGGIPFHHQTIGVWDIQSVLPKDIPPIDGVLSLKTFLHQPFTLDLSSKSLILETQKSLADRVKNMTRLKSRIGTGPDGSELCVFLHGAIQKQGWFLLDSGNLDVVIVSPHLSLNPKGDSVVWETELKLDGLDSIPAKVRVKDIIYDGALSEKFMRKWIFTFDLNSGAVWASPLEK